MLQLLFFCTTLVKVKLIYWDEEEAGFMIEIENRAVPAQDISYYQVIGNKWDNPELLKTIEDIK